MNALFDRTLLLLTAVVAAAFAWGYFHILGESAFIWLLLLMNVALTVENRRLRKLQKLNP